MHSKVSNHLVFPAPSDPGWLHSWDSVEVSSVTPHPQNFCTFGKRHVLFRKNELYTAKYAELGTLSTCLQKDSMMATAHR